MQLTENFSLSELTITQTGLLNDPPEAALAKLSRLASRLEDVRRLLLNYPIVISSGYRSKEVNRAVGGSPNSAHCVGLAVDFTCPRYGSPLEIARAIEASDLPYDQLIHEFGRWVHLGIDGQHRRESLTIDRHGRRIGLFPAR